MLRNLKVYAQCFGRMCVNFSVMPKLWVFEVTSYFLCPTLGHFSWIMYVVAQRLGIFSQNDHYRPIYRRKCI